MMRQKATLQRGKMWCVTKEKIDRAGVKRGVCAIWVPYSQS